jgi:hypothetical protein
VNDLAKLQTEYRADLAANHTVWLKIRFTPGMEMLAQELATGRRIFEQDREPPTSPALREDWGSPHPFSPSPHSPWSSPSPIVQYRTAITRRRSQRWMLDATGSFPTLFIEERLVAFYSTLSEMKQALAEQSPDGRDKVIINIANVITVERVITRQSFAQNLLYPDVADGVDRQQPPPVIPPLTIQEPTEIPLLTGIDQELMFRVIAAGGQPPYRYHMINAPQDLYVTEDGWVRGYIEADQWPVTGYREFLTLILVEDSSIPVQTAGLEFRYRLYPHA